jgi:cobalt/nickel transport system permease protein
MIQNLDDIALLSPLRYKSTSLKVLLFFFGLTAGLLSSSPILPVFIAFCMIFSTLVFGKIPLGFYFKLFIPVLGFAVVSCLVLLFFSSSGDILWSLPIYRWALSITTGSVNLSILVFTRALNGLACMFFLSMTTPMLELFSYFKSIKFLDVFMELTMLIYRYIFVFISLLFSIQFAQKMRFGYHNFKSSIHSAGLLVGGLFVQTIEQGDRLFLSMNSRCYDGKLPYYETSYKLKMQDILLSAVFVISTAAVYVYTRGYQFF